LPSRTQAVLEPRKSPVQARSAASVDALLEATIQVLLRHGKEQLTTTKVAMRAGVSVGTLYQYFPNKSALLQAALERHLEGVAATVERSCEELNGRTHPEMIDALFTAFLHAKMRDRQTSLALHSVSSDVEGARIVRQMAARFHRAIVRMLASSCDKPPTDPELAAFMLVGAMGGISRSLLESGAPAERFETVRRELILLGCGYLSAPRPLR